MRIKRGMWNSKKGSLIDVLFTAGILLSIGMTVLLGFKFMSELNDNFQANDLIDADGKAASQELTNFYPGVIDNSFLMLAIFLALGAFVLASLVRISPIFIPIYLLALVFVIFICGVMSNIYQEMALSPDLSTQADQLVFTSTVLEFLPMIVGVFGSLLAIFMYRTWRNSQEL